MDSTSGFFYKQKTAYEMRISDWSSDVCSSDLAQAQVEAPAVFVGQAVHAPALGVDDFKGLDLKGKIAVLFDGAPERFDNDRRAFHSSWREKLREVIARGAIGAVFVNTARDEASWPWAQRAGDWARPAMRLRGDDGEGIDTFPQIGRAH